MTKIFWNTIVLVEFSYILFLQVAIEKSIVDVELEYMSILQDNKSKDELDGSGFGHWRKFLKKVYTFSLCVSFC